MKGTGNGIMREKSILLLQSLQSQIMLQISSLIFRETEKAQDRNLVFEECLNTPKMG